MRYLPLVCATFVVRIALGQEPGTGPAQAPGSQSVHVELDGKCHVVRPGDVVHYELTIQSVEYAKAVYADLQMHAGRGSTSGATDLPRPDFQSLGGGGAATRDARVGSVYHFMFRIPQGVMSGLYHGTGVFVTVPDEVEMPGRGRAIEVTRHTRDQISRYCLNVISPLGSTDRPVVTNFKAGKIDKK